MLDWQRRYTFTRWCPDLTASASYPRVLIVVGHYDALFAAMGGSTPVLALESLAAAVFLALAVIGFKNRLWLSGRSRRTRNLRPLSSPTDSESRRPEHVSPWGSAPQRVYSCQVYSRQAPDGDLGEGAFG